MTESSPPVPPVAPIRVCVLGLGAGGFHFEVERLVSQLEAPVELILVYTIASQVTGTWAGPTRIARVFVVRSPALLQDSALTRFRLLLSGTWHALGILVATRPHCILAVGTAQAVPFGVAGRLLRIPLFFVDSITRVKAVSLTSRLISHLRLARWNLVQWHSLEGPGRVRYRGGLLS